MDTPINVYSTNQTINGMHINNHYFILYLCYKLKWKFFLGVSINIRTNILYILDSSGSVLSMSNNKISILLTTKKEILMDITIDWLNNHLYILMSSTNKNTIVYSIKQFDYEQQKIEEIFCEFDSEPLQIEVDPLNG